jgi:flavodoxin
MDGTPTITRRAGPKGALLLGMIANAVAVAGPANAQQARGTSDVLVAYLTRTGNTRVIARQIRRALNAELFEIQTVEAYPEDYDEMVAQAERERQSGFEPELAGLLPNIAPYRTVFLGFPIWGTTAPSVIRSFLSKHDLSGKTLIPFITHGGYGLGSSLSVVAEHAPQANLVEGFSMEADQERRTRNQVRDWLGGIQVRR